MTLVGALDTDITDVFTLLAVLLVFVFAFFSTAWARAEEFLDQENPSDSEDRKRLRGRLKSQRRLVISLMLSLVALGGLVAPLSNRAVQIWRWEPFDTVRGGLLLLDIFLLMMVVIASWLWWRLSRKISGL
jgi:hypothetical protein